MLPSTATIMSAPSQAESPRERIAAVPRSRAGCEPYVLLCIADQSFCASKSHFYNFMFTLVDVIVLDRSRHVKCDESNPICQKCLVGGLVCIYQSLVGPRKGTLHRKIAPKRKIAQYQYFEFFKNKNASLLSGYFDTDFWERLVLQLCHQKEFVKHAVVALGSLARNMEVDFDSPLSNNTRHTAPSEHYLFALREYSKFLRLARRNTNKVVELDRLQSILVSCVLTSIFELYQGRQEASIKIVVSGLKIVSSVRE
ncbi:uncharacterized protein EAE98_000104 [Botrytis deweyae]|uniref:Zn(2)-C6 fungal-type domain-containing protein n=1 Tax=Botrytis deweyae TaxID=2478750 RepID=A0ABQ7J1R0_9HELO|nr:uncharacterized protein EAE98_000104 [Botrytis deweyae]KAF7939977.1 hypothetical protein EAE98_000104 [Botrytis deweyae]